MLLQLHICTKADDMRFIAIYNNRISPVFDASKNILILEIKDKKVHTKQVENILPDDAIQKINRLSELGVKELICGAISKDLAQLLDTCNIKTISFIAGKIEDVLSAYLDRALPRPDLRMPGYTK